MKPIYSLGDKVYLTGEDDFIDYEIVEVIAADNDSTLKSGDNFKYKLKSTKGDKTIVKGESEIFPITFA